MRFNAFRRSTYARANCRITYTSIYTSMYICIRVLYLYTGRMFFWPFTMHALVALKLLGVTYVCT